MDNLNIAYYTSNVLKEPHVTYSLLQSDGLIVSDLLGLYYTFKRYLQEKKSENTSKGSANKTPTKY